MEGLKKANTSLLKKRKEKNSVNAKTIVSGLFITVLSAVLGQGSLYKILHPFGFAMIISCPGIYSIFSLIGTSIGLIFSHTGIYLFRYLVCATSLWLIKERLLNSKSRLGNVWFSSFISCFSVCSLTAIAVVIPTRGSIKDFLMFCAEGIIAAFSSFFYKRCILKILKRGDKSFTSREMIDFYISFATIIICITDVKIFTFSPATVIAFFAILFISYIISESQGVTFTCICAAALSTSVSETYQIFPIIFSGIISGFFSPLGKIGSSLSFLTAFSAMSLIADKNKALANIVSALISVLFFILIPEKLYKKAASLLKTKEVSAAENTYRKDISKKLSITAKTVESICSGMNRVSENLKKIDNNFDRDIFCKVQREVCNVCNDKERCWNHSFQYTLKGFEELSKNYRSEKHLGSTSFTKLFLSRCLKQNELKTSLLNNFRKHDEALLDEIRLDEKRLLISQQMKSMSDILNDFSKDFSKCSLVDNELSQKIKDILKSFSIRCTKAICIIDTDGNMTIKAFCKNIESSVDRKNLKSEIEEITFRKFNNPEIDFSPDGTIIVFKQRPWMKMKIGKIQISSNESPICGDCLKEICDDYGNKTIILSDGMGTGGRAAVDASMTAEYFSNLIESYISPDNALKIVNSVLSVKSTNESLSTIDVAKFNLFSGKVEFFKAGAAVSFIRKNGKCSVIESVSLPVGILNDVSFAKEKVMLSKGDIVVMVSDGAISDSTDWIEYEIENFNQSDPDILAQKIASSVCEKSHGNRRDDITIFVGIMTA